MTQRTIPRPSANNIFLAIILALLAVGAAGCDELLAPRLIPHTSPLLRARPDTVRILKGDTTRTIACSQVGSCIPVRGGTGNTPVRWSVTDNNVLAMIAPSDTDSLGRSTSVLVRARKSGVALVNAVSDSLGSSSAWVFAVDSSAVDHIMVLPELSAITAPLRVGGTTTYYATLSADLEWITGRPTSYEIPADSSITVEERLKPDFRVEFVVHAHKAGNHELRVRFLNIVKPVPIAVIP